MTITYELGGKTFFLRLDATLSERHDATATVTEHPVETGVDVTDHVRQMSDTISVEALITNHPIHSAYDDFFDGAQGGFAPHALQIPQRDTYVTNPISAALARYADPPPDSVQVLYFDALFNRPLTVYAALLQVKNTVTLLKIDSGVRTYENMVITALSVPKDDAADSLKFSFDATALRVAASEVVESPRPKEERGKKRKNKGTQQPVDASKNQSLLSKGIGKLAALAF